MRRTPSRFPARNQGGFTLIETLIASTISLVAMAALVQLNISAMRYTAEGFYEAKVLKDASQALDQISRQLNRAYRLDAAVPANAFSIQNNFQTLEYSVPNPAGGAPLRERYRFDATGKKLYHERRNGGVFTQVEGTALLTKVKEFAVDNQEGIINLVVRMELSLPRYGTKQFTLIGRALPRNI